MVPVLPFMHKHLGQKERRKMKKVEEKDNDGA
jgi:hypothetical protein